MPFNLDEETSAAPAETNSGGFNFDQGNNDEFERQAAQRNAQRLISEQALAAGESAASEVRNGRPVVRYGTQWDEVRQRLEENNPNHGLDLSRAEEAFQQIRETSFNQGLLKPPEQGRGERDWARTPVSFAPYVRHLFDVKTAGEERAVRNRIQAGTASQEDYFDYQQRLRNERYQADRPGWQVALEGAAILPTLGLEFRAAAPFAEAAAGAVGMPLGTGATSLIGRGVQGTPGWLAGGVAGYAAQPTMVASSIFRRINPHVGEADATATDVFKGWLDGQIEYLSESLGEPLQAGAAGLLGGPGRMTGNLVSRLPGGPRAALVANGLAHWATANRGSQAFQEGLRRTGFNGLFGEWLEERAGEIARGATGVEQDYGFTGNVGAALRGDRRAMGAAFDQLAIEGLTFAPWTAITGLVGSAAANRAARRLQSQGMSASASQNAVRDATVSVLQDPAAVANVPASLREYAEALAEQFHQPAQGPQPGLEAQTGEAPPVEQKAAQGPSPGLEAMPAETPVPNETIPGSAEPNSATEALVAPTPTTGEIASASSSTAPTDQLPAPTPPVSPQAKPGALEGKPATETLADLHGRIDAWRDVQGRIAAGEAVSDAERSIVRPSVEDIAKAARLKPREAKVLHDRLIEGKTQEAIGEELGVTRERVRQIEAEALGKMTNFKLSVDKLNTGGKAKKGESKAKRVREFPASMEGSAFSPEEAKKNPAIKAAIAKANSPLTHPELRAKLMDAAVSLILKGKFDAANKELADAGASPLTEEDYQAISGLSFGSVTKATVETAKAAQAQQPTKGAKGIQAKPDVRLAAASVADAARAIGVRLYEPAEGDFGKRLYDLGRVDTQFLDDNYSQLGLGHNESFRYLGQVYDNAIGRGLTKQQIEKKIAGAKEKLSETAAAIRSKGESAGIANVHQVADFYDTYGEKMANEAESRLLQEAGVLFSSNATAAKQSTSARKSTVTYDSPTHQALVARLHQSLLDSPLPPRLKAEFGGHVSNVVANMPLKVATAVLQNVKGVKWFSATADLTQFVAETSSKAAEIMEQGKLIGGVYYPSLGLLYLDGDNNGESAAEIYAHEFTHALEGPTKKYSDSREWGSIFLAELSTGQLTTYGSTNQTEAFAEFGRAMYGEGQGATALAGKFPRATAFMVKHGLMPDSKTNFEKPSEIFETSINDGKLHGDILFSIGPLTSEQAARAQISATGAAEPRVPQPLIQQAQDRLEDSLAVLDRLTAKQVPFGSAPQRKGADLRTVFWGMMGSARQAADKWFSQGVTQWRLNPDGTRTEVRTTKPATWITEGIDAKRLQVGKEGETSQWGAMLIANHVVNEVEAGSQMMQSKDEAVQAIGAKKVATASPEQVATFRAFLEDAKAKDPAWYAQAMESASRYTAYMNAMRQSLVAVGYHKQEDVDKMIAAFPDFVPLARVMDETPFKTELNKARKGSGRRFVDPLTTLRARTLVTNFFVARQLINNTLWDGGKVQQGTRGVENFWTEREKPKKFDGDVTDIDRALKALGMEEDLRAEVIGMLGDSSLAYMNTNPWHPTGENVYSMRIDGRPVSIEIHDRSLYEVLTGQQGGDAISNLAKAVAGLPGVAQLAKLQKGGATVTSIVFPVRNLFRDPWTYFQNAIPHVGFTQAFTNLAHGTWDAFRAKGQELLGKPIDKEAAKLYFAGRGEGNRAFSFAPRGEGEAALRLMRGESLGGLKGKSIAAINKVKDMLEFWGSFEHAGRIAEHDAALRDMGYTEAEIAKNKAASPNESPIPLHAMLYAQLRGAQSTTDFSKKGSWVKEWDKSVPFFGPHIAGVAQETRNWQEAGKELRQGKIGPKMKAMGGVMAVYLAMEILHWWKYKDDDWYNELDANQRYRWFILGRYGKGIAGIPKPHGLTTLAGAYLQELLRLESGNAARFDMATLNVPNELVPRAAPVGLGEAFQVARNTSWSGMPIVPSNEDRHLGDFDKWMKYRAPYIIDQLSGGFLSERVFRMPWDALTASSVSPHQSVTDAYERLNQLDQERFAYRERGVLFPREAEYRRLNQITTGLRNISSAIRGDRRVGNTVVKGEPPSEERIRELRRRQVELARLVQTR